MFFIRTKNKDKINNADDIDANSMQYFKTLHYELLNNGVYLGPSGYEVGFVSAAYTIQDLDKTILAFKNAINKLKLN